MRTDGAMNTRTRQRRFKLIVEAQEMLVDYTPYYAQGAYANLPTLDKAVPAVPTDRFRRKPVIFSEFWRDFSKIIWHIISFGQARFQLRCNSRDTVAG
jgi:hypothetical protein